MSVVKFPKSDSLDVTKLQRRSVPGTLLSPAATTAMDELAPDHTSEPIKSIDDIYRIANFLLDNHRYRDHMLFITGINFGLRIGDLLQLRFSSLINPDMTFKDTFAILEQKTKNTRKVRKNRYITVCDAVIDAVLLYLENAPYEVSLSDYMFRSESNHKSKEDKPLDQKSAYNIITGIARDLQLDMKVSTHTLRKTFGYHIMMQSDNSQRQLILLSKIYGHSSTAQTLAYIGITKDEIASTYRSLNLGQTDKSLIGTHLLEADSA